MNNTTRMNDVNLFSAQGVIEYIGSSKDNKKYIRLKTRNFRGPVSLIISLQGNAGHGIKSGTHVIIKGYVRAFCYHNEYENKEKEVLMLVATSVQRDKSELCQRFGLNVGSVYVEEAPMVFVAGYVIDVKKSIPWEVITINTCGGATNRHSMQIPMLHHFDGCSYGSEIARGDFIVASVFIDAIEKERPNRRSFIDHRLVVKEIVKVSQV